MEQHGRLVILRQPHIDKHISLVFVVLKEPNQCYHCGKKIHEGTLVRRQQLLKNVIRYYHLECQLMGANHKRSRRDQSNIDANANVQMSHRC
jgi:hypothetical protein